MAWEPNVKLTEKTILKHPQNFVGEVRKDARLIHISVLEPVLSSAIFYFKMRTFKRNL